MTLFLLISRWTALGVASLATHASFLLGLIVCAALLDHSARFPSGRPGGAIILHEGRGQKGSAHALSVRLAASKPCPAFHPGLTLPKPVSTTSPAIAMLSAKTEVEPPQPSQPDAVASSAIHATMSSRTTPSATRPAAAPQSMSGLARGITLAAASRPATASLPVAELAIGQSGRMTTFVADAGASESLSEAGTGRGEKGAGQDAYDSALGAAGDGQGPSMLGNAKPPYPELARLNRWQGTVLLRVKIEADGRVTSAEVIGSSGFPLLDEAARETVSRWRGVPAIRGGRAISTIESQEIVFSLP